MSSPSPITAPPPSPAISTQSSRIGRSHTRRFHRRFPDVDQDELILDYYSCALLADILLQGQLYITENYFAFYSNIFGHKTQILIPVRDVVEVTKECTARIIPNAVGICTEDEKYVFGSLLSRNSTYQLMQQIWMTSADPDLSKSDDTESGNTSPLLLNGTEDEDTLDGPILLHPLPSLHRRVSRRHSDLIKAQIPFFAKRRGTVPASVFSLSTKTSRHSTKDYLSKAEDIICAIYRLPRATILLLVTTILLGILLMSATILLYRITLVHHKVSLLESRQRNQKQHRYSANVEAEQRREAIKKDIKHINENLKERIGIMAKVRQSFEQFFKVASQMPQLCDSRNMEKPSSTISNKDGLPKHTKN